MTTVLKKNIGPYQLIEFIDRDDITIRYKGFQFSISRYVTIHVLVPDLAEDQTFIRRFRRDVQRIAQLKNRYILPIYDYGQYEGLIYTVTRYPIGSTLRDWQPSTQASRQTLNLMCVLVNALDSVHQQGLVHGNLKPSNILIDPPGHPLLTGFGFAQKIADMATNTIYMSPDRIQGRPVDQRDDIYALGVILHEILLGEPPTKPYHRQPRRDHSTLTAEVAGIIRQAIAPAANERFQTTGQLNCALTRAMDRAEKPASLLPRAAPTTLAAIDQDWRWLQFFWGSLGVLCLIVAFNVSLLYFSTSADSSNLPQMIIENQPSIEQFETIPPADRPTAEPGGPQSVPEMIEPSSEARPMITEAPAAE